MVGGSASLLRQGGAQGMQSSTQGIPVQHLDDTFQQLARVFEIASGETQVSAKGRSPTPYHSLLLAPCARLHAFLPLQVDQPLCTDCAAKIKEEVEASLAEAEAECAAYQAALDELAQQNDRPMPQAVHILKHACFHPCV